jgi:transcriptional antiterminator NusG
MTEPHTTPEAAAPVAAPSTKRWYIVHAYSGMEKAVERNLRERIDRAGMQEKFGRILVPMEEVVELKNGKKSVTERRFFPGYVLVEMEMADDTWHLVKHTGKVTGFVGGAKNRPSPISEAEVLKIVHQMQEGVEKPRPKVEWSVGELVRVKEGPFTDFNGAIEDVNYDKSKVRVSVTIFGRATPVELDFSQVEKV